MEIRFSMATRANASAPEKLTSGVMSFPDGIPMWVCYGFLAFAKVKLQGQFRRKGIPASWKGNAESLAPGAREVGVREMTPAEAKGVVLAEVKADSAKRRQIMAELQAMEDAELAAEEAALARLEEETRPDPE